MDEGGGGYGAVEPNQPPDRRREVLYVLLTSYVRVDPALQRMKDLLQGLKNVNRGYVVRLDGLLGWSHHCICMSRGAVQYVLSPLVAHTHCVMIYHSSAVVHITPTEYASPHTLRICLAGCCVCQLPHSGCEGPRA